MGGVDALTGGGSRRLGVAAAWSDGVIVPGDVVVDGDRVTAIGASPAGRTGLAVPGFVDLQVNGFAGIDLSDADVDGYRAASAAMARSGVTTFLATVPTAHPDRYGQVLGAAAAACRAPLPGAQLAGVHLEGPFLSPRRAGAHPAPWLQTPRPEAADRLLAAAPVVLMTVAPELDGGLDLIRHLRHRGVVVALGHSDADAATAHAAVDAGATAVTHLWNAQRPLAARDPGVIGVALTRREVSVCLIADLVHLAPETLALSVAAAGDRAVVVTDAVAACGLADGTYRAHGRTVTLEAGAVRLADGTLAGGATPMDAAVRNLVAIGAGVEDAVAAATARPAALIGRPDRGRLAPSGTADLVVLDDQLQVGEVLVAGRPVADQ